MKLLRLLLPLILLSNITAHTVAAAELRIYAAASLTNALNDIGSEFTKETGIRVTFSYAGSPTLAKQIESGATADLFFSADEDWMNYLQQRHLINPDTRIALLSNTLVMIAPIEPSVSFKSLDKSKLDHILKNERFSVADPDSVPAGRYAREALQHLDLWSSVRNKLVISDNVRGALNFVALSESPLGIVYETDARLEKRVKVVYRFGDQTHSPIIYPIAQTTSASPESAGFIQYLQSAKAKQIFNNYGFVNLQ
jgi:molybdate transport system substrate-binding protein